MNDFITVMLQDLKHVDPSKIDELKKGLTKINNKPIIVYDSYLCGRAQLKLNDATNKIFMFRPYVQDTPLPHDIKDYKLFVESSSKEVYVNYAKTLETLSSKKDCCTRDKKRLALLFDSATPLNIFSWSNTGILLNNMMHDENYKDKFINANIITFGSPVLVKKKACKKCINIYHQDDWILGLLKIVYNGFDFSTVKKNIVHKTTTNEEFIILSRACFKHSTTSPHQSFDIFL
jgi:hypothetical protein